jgi:hypothetical protein
LLLGEKDAILSSRQAAKFAKANIFSLFYFSNLSDFAPLRAIFRFKLTLIE